METVVRRTPGADASTVRMSARLQQVAEALPDEWTARARALEQLGTTRPSLQRLVDAGIAELAERPATAGAWMLPDDDGDADAEGDGGSGSATAHGLETGEGDRAGTPQLTAEQLAAVELVESSTSDDPATLLRGITGSGKTEVYLELIQRALNRSCGAIVLVPEIALTPQTAGRFQRRFGARVEVLHSNQTPSERRSAYARIAAGRADVVIGPRSAIFAPVSNLGIIVVDEEHDGSYKQESEPRYDARRVAFRRAQLAGARLVLGSATPRPESRHGVRRVAQLVTRPAGGRLAPVELVDLRLHGDNFPLTDHVRVALDQTLRRGAKAIVLHNRRGYAAALHCRGCGVSMRCVNCDVALTLHSEPGRRSKVLLCHHCGFDCPVPSSCPSCRSAELARVGAGSERIERELQESFDVPVLRLDADAARTRGHLFDVLERFSAPGPAVLTGTQMIAKGHDFADVELAVVIDADSALAIPDFRSQERAFSLVAQLAGRAGRSAATAEHARVVVQSWNPEAEFLALARAHDVEGFLELELERRRELRYPPFSRLVRLVVSAPHEDAVRQWAVYIGERVRAGDFGEVLGPAPLIRISGRERAQVLVKTSGPAKLAAAARAFLRSSEPRRRRDDVRVVLDVDPQSLL